MQRLGLIDEVEKKKQKQRAKTRKNREGVVMKMASNFIGKAIERASQRTHRFIRWLRSQIYFKAPLSEAIARLAAIWGCKI
jgi:hypothetical protein